MKKFLAISVAIIYLAISCGLVLQVHYCMGKEAGAAVSLSASNDHACPKCGMEKGKNKCCHDEVKFIKLQDVHKQVTTDFQYQEPVVPEQEYNFINPLFHFVSNYEGSVSDNSPPLCISPSPCILYCVFRI